MKDLDIEEKPWCTLKNLNAEAVVAILRVLQQLEKLNTPDHVLHDRTETLPERLRAVPPVAVLCQVFAVVAEHQSSFVEVNGNLGFRSKEDLVGVYVDALLESDYIRNNNDMLRPIFSVVEVLPRIFHVRTESRFVLAASFVRFQEHYESPDPAFRSRAFALGELRNAYRTAGRRDSSKNGWSYYLDWPGFNVPGRVIDFCEDNMQPLRAVERALLDVIRSH